MRVERHILKNLILKNIKGELNPEEEATLNDWARIPENEQLLNHIKEETSLTAKLNSYSHYRSETEKYKNKIKDQLNNEGGLFDIKSKINWQRYSVAASIFFMLAIGMYLWTSRDKKTEEAQSTAQETIIGPGKDGAILSLADGKEILLDETTNGTVAKQGESDVVKKDGLLSYSPTGGIEKVVYNTLTTPRGRQYQLALADGSRIWLNASSAVTFPSAFPGSERRIEISGECYMEISKDAKPFIISVNGMDVLVHGTILNINAYTEESNIKTTLIEGSISVRKGNKTVMIKPGQQAQVKGESIAVIENADTEAAIAWKNGLIVLDRADIHAMLRSIARWYDVEVEVKGNLVAPEFIGKLPRNLTLNQLLDALEMNSNIKFNLENRKVTVSQ